MEMGPWSPFGAIQQKWYDPTEAESAAGGDAQSDGAL